jgi:hypothetical protein
VLLTRVGNTVTYLSPIVRSGETPQPPGLTMEMSTPDLDAAFAVTESNGFAPNLRDYTGRRVVVAARAISGAPWVLMHTVDYEEALGAADTRFRALTVMLGLALLVIAIAYSDAISLVPLAIAAGLFGALYALRWAPSRWRIEAAALLAFGIWVSLHGSGVDPVIAGLAIGLVTSAYTPRRGSLERAIELTRSFREQPTRELAKTARRGVAAAISPNERLQHALHPWTSYVIVPLFALANIGVHVDRDLVESAVRSPVTLGIFFGYVVGKPAGIVGGAWVATRLGAQRRLSWPAIGGLGAVAGIGFTISLLISSIAFDGRALDEARLGVLAAAIVASLGAWAVFWRIRRLPAHVRAHQLSGAADELLDLSEDVDPERDHVRGPDDAPVTLVEYGDYQCQYCGEAEVVVRELLTSFDDDLRYVWRHLPLSDVHPNAQMAAEASEAAAAQGAFWEMHDTLFAHQDELGSGDLRNYAEELGLDVGRLSDDLTRRAHARRVADDVATADASGVAGTPSFFVNGRRHHGAYDTASLSAAVSAARARALAARHSHAAGV